MKRMVSVAATFAAGLGLVAFAIAATGSPQSAGIEPIQPPSPVEVELDDGDVCTPYAGPAAEVEGKPVTFECASGGMLAGEIDRSGVPWTVQFDPGDGAGVLQVRDIADTRSFQGQTAEIGAPVDGEPTGALFGVQMERVEGAHLVTWDFGDGGMPSYRVRYARVPAQEPGTGDPVDVQGETMLGVEFFPARRGLMTDDGIEEIYPGPARLPADDNDNIHEAVLLGDFEAEMTWYLGMEVMSGFEVTVLDDPARLVLRVYDPVPAVAEQPELGIGDEGEAVEVLEQLLLERGYFLDQDRSGSFGEPQRRAVVAFQEARGLVPNGVAGPETWAELAGAPPQAAATGSVSYTIPGIARNVPGQAPPPPTPTPTPSPTPSPTPAPQPTPTPTPPPAAGTIYLTFDDGPHATWTPAILDTLAQHGAQGTFFVVGQEVQRHPGILVRTVNEGHAVGNHSFSHADLTGLGREAFFNEVQGTQQVIQQTVGVTPTCLRPPYGRVDATVTARAAELGLSIELWDIDTHDWRLPGAQVIANHVIENAYDGAVVLMHDGSGNRSQTAAALETILAQLGGAGYTFGAMDC